MIALEASAFSECPGIALTDGGDGTPGHINLAIGSMQRDSTDPKAKPFV